MTANVAFEKGLQRHWNLKKRLLLPNFGNQTSEMFVFQRRSSASSSSSSSSTEGTTAADASSTDGGSSMLNNQYVKHGDDTATTALVNQVAPPVKNVLLHIPELRLSRCDGCARTCEEASLSNRQLRRCVYCRNCVYCSKKCFALCNKGRDQRHAMRCIFFKEKVLTYPQDFTAL